MVNIVLLDHLLSFKLPMQNFGKGYRSSLDFRPLVYVCWMHIWSIRRKLDILVRNLLNTTICIVVRRLFLGVMEITPSSITNTSMLCLLAMRIKTVHWVYLTIGLKRESLPSFMKKEVKRVEKRATINLWKNV